jgi:outer membrane lipoprotein SlyB
MLYAPRDPDDTMHALRTPPPLLRRLLALVLAASLAACSVAPKAPEFSGTGTAQSIREIREPNTLATVAGALGGALIGGVAGAGIGGGSGQAAAASVLSVAGGTGGAALAQWLGMRTRYEVLVRFEDGIDRAFTLDAMPGFKPGATVRVVDGALQK